MPFLFFSVACVIDIPSYFSEGLPLLPTVDSSRRETTNSFSKRLRRKKGCRKKSCKKFANTSIALSCILFAIFAEFTVLDNAAFSSSSSSTQQRAVTFIDRGPIFFSPEKITTTRYRSVGPSGVTRKRVLKFGFV